MAPLTCAVCTWTKPTLNIGRSFKRPFQTSLSPSRQLCHLACRSAPSSLQKLHFTLFDSRHTRCRSRCSTLAPWQPRQPQAAQLRLSRVVITVGPILLPGFSTPAKLVNASITLINGTLWCVLRLQSLLRPLPRRRRSKQHRRFEEKKPSCFRVNPGNAFPICRY